VVAAWFPPAAEGGEGVAEAAGAAAAGAEAASVASAAVGFVYEFGVDRVQHLPS